MYGERGLAWLEGYFRGRWRESIGSAGSIADLDFLPRFYRQAYLLSESFNPTTPTRHTATTMDAEEYDKLTPEQREAKDKEDRAREEAEQASASHVFHSMRRALVTNHQ